jgi:hypothetical protein
MPGLSPPLVVPRRFRGPATSGNGGWTAGALATLLAGAGDTPQPPFRVRLSAPPPLETPLAVRDGKALLDEQVILEATELGEDETRAQLLPVPPVPYDAAVDAGLRYAGLSDHPFPECFSCGPERSPGDGLRLRPGPVEGHDGVVAAAWRPDDSVVDGSGQVAVPVLWAALDCPGGWAVDLAGRPMVLGTMTASIRARPRPGEALVVTARALSVSDRKATTATTLYGDDGVLAVAAHVWIIVDPGTFGRQGSS